MGEVEWIDSVMAFNGNDLLLNLKPGNGLYDFLIRVKMTEDKASKWTSKRIRKEYAFNASEIFIQFQLVYKVKTNMKIDFTSGYSLDYKDAEELANIVSSLNARGFVENGELLKIAHP